MGLIFVTPIKIKNLGVIIPDKSWPQIEGFFIHTKVNRIGNAE